MRIPFLAFAIALAVSATTLCQEKAAAPDLEPTVAAPAPETFPPTSVAPVPPTASSLKPASFNFGVEVASLDEPPIHTEEFFMVKDRLASGRDRVAVDVFRPPSPGLHPAVVILHGTHGPGRAEKYYLKLSEDLARHGYIGLFVRYYDRGRKGKGSRAQWAQTIGDTLTFAASLPGSDPERMAIIGYSQGAFLALNDAPSDPRVRAVVAFYGGLSPGFFPQAQNDMPPTLLFHGTADRIVPVRRSIETLKILRQSGHPADLVIYPGAVHGFNLNSLPGPDAFAAEDSWARSLAFLDFHLRYPAWTPAVTPLDSPSGTPSPAATPDAPFAQPPLAHASIPYLAPPEPGAEGTALIDPTLEQLEDIMRHAPPPRRHQQAKGNHRSKQGKGHTAKSKPGVASGHASTKPSKPAQTPIMP